MTTAETRTADRLRAAGTPLRAAVLQATAPRRLRAALAAGYDPAAGSRILAQRAAEHAAARST